MDRNSWKERLFDVLDEVNDGLKKITAIGVKKSEELSRFAGHRVKRTLLERERNHLFQSLGQAVFQLVEEKKATVDGVEDFVKQIQGLNDAIRMEDAEIRPGADKHDEADQNERK